MEQLETMLSAERNERARAESKKNQLQGQVFSQEGEEGDTLRRLHHSLEKERYDFFDLFSIVFHSFFFTREYIYIFFRRTKTFIEKYQIYIFFQTLFFFHTEYVSVI